MKATVVIYEGNIGTINIPWNDDNYNDVIKSVVPFAFAI